MEACDAASAAGYCAAACALPRVGRVRHVRLDLFSSFGEADEGWAFDGYSLWMMDAQGTVYRWFLVRGEAAE